MRTSTSLRCPRKSPQRRTASSAAATEAAKADVSKVRVSRQFFSAQVAVATKVRGENDVGAGLGLDVGESDVVGDTVGDVVSASVTASVARARRTWPPSPPPPPQGKSTSTLGENDMATLPVFAKAVTSKASKQANARQSNAGYASSPQPPTSTPLITTRTNSSARSKSPSRSTVSAAKATYLAEVDVSNARSTTQLRRKQLPVATDVVVNVGVVGVLAVVVGDAVEHESTSTSSPPVVTWKCASSTAPPDSASRLQPTSPGQSPSVTRMT
mmetsp:Transcript_2284/g.7672  ORF Transcript_2284/g.7672 Transcript_2284/m.7672 type:complete len:271 (-) Transcript_2284:338-1150(-)